MEKIFERGLAIVLDDELMKAWIFKEIFEWAKKKIADDINIMWNSEDRKIISAFLTLRKQGKFKVTRSEVASSIEELKKKEYMFYRSGPWLRAFERLVKSGAIIEIPLGERKILYSLNEKLLLTLNLLGLN